MRLIAAVLVASCVALPAVARTVIACRAPGQEDVLVSLQDRVAFGRTLDCVSGRFAVGITPCAPLGGFGVSAAAGDAGLVAVFNRRQDAIRAVGGVTGHYATATMISFNGGHVSPGTGYQDDWSFLIDRATGLGRLEERGKAPVTYSCDKAAARF